MLFREELASITIAAERGIDLANLIRLCKKTKQKTKSIRIIQRHITELQSQLLPESTVATLATFSKHMDDCSTECHKELSDKPEDVLAYIDILVETYKYRKLPKSLSSLSRDIYLASLPKWAAINGSNEGLASDNGTLVARRFDRVVIGDYGAFVEIQKKDMVRENICCEKGQEYRYRDPKYKDSVKYYWYTTKCSSAIKIYYQQKAVTYADYKPNCFYISPFESCPVSAS